MKKNLSSIFSYQRIGELSDPKSFDYIECPETSIPVIIALDVTASMGPCIERILDQIQIAIEKFNNIDVCMMSVGDIEYDRLPIQITDFLNESDKEEYIWIESGGGNNIDESYSLAWYAALHKIKCHQRGIIITIGDEPINSYLSAKKLSKIFGESIQKDISSKELFEEAQKKFDIFHIAVADPDNLYSYFSGSIKLSFERIIGDRLKISTIDNLSKTIEGCIN